MNRLSLSEAIAVEAGSARTAALAAWVQSLAMSEADKPVLVGGAAVELYSGGAYRTGDLDFVGEIGKEGESRLEGEGFQKRGRHWIHQELQIYLEFPGSDLADGESAAVIEFGDYSVVVIGLEELIVDRLAAWQFWQSEIDAINAFRLRQVREAEIDERRLRQLAELREVSPALRALNALVERTVDGDPSVSELEEWSRNGLEEVG